MTKAQAQAMMTSLIDGGYDASVLKVTDENFQITANTPTYINEYTVQEFANNMGVELQNYASLTNVTFT